jgi:spore maturation protein SpmA
MKIAEKSGLVNLLARALRPLLRWLFPDVPANHPAMGSMVMNMAANMLGLSNAATPLGLRAMQDLEKLNPRPGTATNAMCTFLAINTSSIQLIPATTVAILAAAGSASPTAIIGTTFFATCCSTIAAILAVKTFERLPMYALPKVENPTAPTELDSIENSESFQKPKWWGTLILLAFAGCFLIFGWEFIQAQSATRGPLVNLVDAVSYLAIPFLLAFFPLYGSLSGVKVYEEFVEGAKEGFKTSVMIIPYLVVILVAIGMFREAGGIKLLSDLLKPALGAVGFPTELLPLSLVRPLSGSGSLGLFSDIVKEFGPDSFLARTAGTIFGSTETTFYVIAVYFGAVGVKRTRHAIPAGLIADAVGIIASVIICKMMFG